MAATPVRALQLPAVTFELPAVRAALEQAFPPPTFKLHVVSAEEALLLQLAEHELDDACLNACCGCFGLKTPNAISYSELSPETARHQWTLGIDGNQLTCVRKCGAARQEAVFDGGDAELEQVMRRLPEVVAALASNPWLVSAQMAAPSQDSMLTPDAVEAVQEKQLRRSESTSTGGSSSRDPASLRSLCESVSSKATSRASSEAPRIMGVADEIRKMAELLREGVLTDEEFQSHKRRLLSEPFM